MASSSPFPYTRASRHASPLRPAYNFDPKAVSRASWSSVASPKPKQNGPLLNYNRHPDSYFIVPSRFSHIPALPSRTKKRIITSRWIQFGLRISQLVVALGLLTCVICLRGINDVQSWILRIPPAWDACVASYAILHLLRPAKARTPLSSASYHTFSFFMDVGLIPFMAINAFFSENNWSTSEGEDGIWRSVFTATGATNILLCVTWVVALFLGSLHLISAMIDLYLVIIFRKIAKYPADSNPLEDNLTSRAATKHKYKDSDLIISEKSASMSDSTLASDGPISDNMSTAKLVPQANVRRPMAYHQSRSGTLYQQPKPTSTSRHGLVEHASSYRTYSRGDSSRGHSRSRSRSRPRSQGSRSASLTRPERCSYQSEHDPMPTSPHNFLSAGDRPARYNTPLLAPRASNPAHNDTLMNSNWCILSEDDQSDISTARRTPIRYASWAHDLDHDDNVSDTDDRNPNAAQLSLHAKEEKHLLPLPLKPQSPSTTPTSAHPICPVSYSSVYSDMASTHERDTGDGISFRTASTFKDHGAFYFSDMAPGSLELDGYGNSHTYSADGDPSNDINSAHDSEGTIGRAYTISAGSSFHFHDNDVDHARSSIPRRRVYGDLEQSIREPSPSVNTTLAIPSKFRAKNRSQEREAPTSPHRHQGQSSRIISRTGVDIDDDANIMYIDQTPGAIGMRNRQVSGKVAEEGQAGAKSVWWGGDGSGLKSREVSGAA